MKKSISSRLRELENAAPPPAIGRDFSHLRSEDLAFLNKMIPYRLAGGEFANDEDRKRYHDILLGDDEWTLSLEARGNGGKPALASSAVRSASAT